MGLGGYASADTISVMWQANIVAADYMNTNYALGGEVGLTLMAGGLLPSATATANRRVFRIPGGRWALTGLFINYKSLASDDLKVRVTRLTTTGTDDATSGTDLIDNLLTAGAARVDYISSTATGATQLEYLAPQAGAGAYDNGSPAVKAKVWTNGTPPAFSFAQGIGVTVQSAGTPNIQGLLVSAVLSRTGGSL